MSEATISLAIASLADAVSALARGDHERMQAKLDQVDSTLSKAAEQRSREGDPVEVAKTIAEGMQRLAEITARSSAD